MRQSGPGGERVWKAEVGADESSHGFDLIKFTLKNRSDVEVLFWSFLSVNFGSTVDNCYFLWKLVATVFLGTRQPALIPTAFFVGRGPLPTSYVFAGA